ncbi:MAG TPA: phosphate/phosphite/phosphonate ABC transporter substrate-binding protein [Polyangiaceae bacterium]|jgi:ABC-type phosphate/phosphonate transport system substrate-binding protein
MDQLLIGAVAYDPKVVTIWEGIRSYLRGEAKLDAEVVLFLSYEAQVDALLAGKIDIAWNTNLAFLQSLAASGDRCQPIAMRDTDLDWRTLFIAPTGGGLRSLDDLRGKRIALGSRDSGHAAILPVHFLAQSGLVEGRDFTAVRFDSDVGKHGDTGRSEVEVLRAVLDGSVDAGAVGSPFWHGLSEQGIAPEGALTVVWETPSYHHCMFTGRADLEPGKAVRFAQSLFAMSYENPAHRPILELEGLKQWVPPRLQGYESLKSACVEQRLFKQA